ncbi:site-2 protease family protein [bacterium]|nr:site-2 protease family protein [bacterium]
MTKRAIKKISKKIVSGRMKVSPLSRFIGAPVYSVEKTKLSEQETLEIQEELFQQGIFSDLEVSEKKYYLKIIVSGKFAVIRSTFIHTILFLFTIITTTFTGSLLQGKNPFNSWEEFTYGFAYSFALLTILLLHEMGHYFAARYYKVETTLPYFIPFFFPGFHPGTLGAFIKMRSLIPSKKALFDIGIAGPLAGLAASIVFLFIGFSRLPDSAGINAHILQIHPLDLRDGMELTLGHTLLFDWISSFFGGDRLSMSEMYHFPFIFAGWFGLLVTAINLFPIGQLDGGHVSYALFGRKSRWIAYAFFGFLVILTIHLIINFNSYIWVIWVFLIFFLIRFSHPSTLDDSTKLGFVREMLGRFAFIILFISFSPMPIYVPN